MSNPEMMEALQALAAEKGISVDTLLSALADALASAYQRMPGAHGYAWVTIDPSNFDIRVHARDIDEAGDPTGPEMDVTPKDFGRIAAQTARQVMTQRIREAAPSASRPPGPPRTAAIRNGILVDAVGDAGRDGGHEQLSTSSDPAFDVFMSYSRIDERTVVDLASQLREQNLRPWLDVEQIRAGARIAPAIADGLSDSRCLAVFVGAEARSIDLSRLDDLVATELTRTRWAFLVILPTAPQPLTFESLPASFAQLPWVDLRDVEPDKWANMLAAAITGTPTGLLNDGAGGRSEVAADVTVSPMVEEAIHFERLWSIVERAVDLGRLTPEVEDEIRALNQIRHMAERLPVERYDDLTNMIGSKLSALLPQVIDDLAPGVDPPITPALRAAARDEAHNVQLEVLDEALTATARQLEEVAEEVTAAAAASGEDVEPYLRQPVERLVETAQRIGATLRRIDDALVALSGTKVGRKIARLGYVGVRSAGSVVLAAGAATQANLPLAGNLQAATVAVISAAVGNWLYSRRRRVDPTLPSATRGTDRESSEP